MKRCIVVATAAVALAACATAPVPVYQAANELGRPGYFTTRAEGGRYTVAYTGAKGMSRAQVAEYAMLRAAELTMESGQEWFAVIDTQTQNVKLTPTEEELQERSGGGFVGGESTGTGAGGAGGSSSPRGVSDSATRGGPSTGGFGGGDVPYQVLERWTPPTVPQTIMVIQMGKGAQADFAGLDRVPEIFAAQSVAAEIRGKMDK